MQGILEVVVVFRGAVLVSVEAQGDGQGLPAQATAGARGSAEPQGAVQHSRPHAAPLDRDRHRQFPLQQARAQRPVEEGEHRLGRLTAQRAEIVHRVALEADAPVRGADRFPAVRLEDDLLGAVPVGVPARPAR
ncbi:hypothetical protein GCM10022232_59300 [Streptomyces plumbiresistens]|uniref:Uncharacterized protein n=1 Tax=Streptomyces plumbiresistens TaxID=511811 RepID=A0ABP7SDY2_9ACTN